MDSQNSDEAQDGGKDRYLRKYAGRWIARIGSQVVGQGGTPDQALYAAKNFRHKETPDIIYVPTINSMSISNQIVYVIRVLPDDQPVYLVGGAVRDALLGRSIHDLDFVVAKDSLKIARRVANSLGAAYYPLDETRETARVIIQGTDNHRQVLDFALFRGPDLESDLSARDFTINAMAVELGEPERLLDPLSGLADLQAKRLRACSANAFRDDPVRILRGIRLAAAFEFRIIPETRKQMRRWVPELPGVSPERLRDEFFRILDGNTPATSLRALDILGAIPYILPELEVLKDNPQPASHGRDLWRHTLDLLSKLEILLSALKPIHDPDTSASFMLGLVSVQLGRYRDKISAHLNEHLVPERSIRPLLFFAGLYHETGKPESVRNDPDVDTTYGGYEQISADILRQRGRELRLSNEEIDYAARIVRYHMRPNRMAREDQPPSGRSVYRFFRSAGQTGVDICLLSMANLWATHGPSISQEIWTTHLAVVRALLEGWFENYGEVISPPRLLDGHELMDELNLPSGPELGEYLEAIREAQAAGEVRDREQALEYVKSLREGA